jgi:hypothetical protein
MDEVKSDWEEYESSKVYKKVWQKHVEGGPLSLKEEYMLEEKGYREPVRVKRPGHMLLVDDCQGTNLFSSARKNPMTHMVIKHRHIPISMAFMMQTWIGLPRPIRLNATQFMIYKTHDKNQIYQLYQSFGNLVTWDRFMEMYREATSSPHGFLYIDTTPKREEQRFRKGFNEYFPL